MAVLWKDHETKHSIGYASIYNSGKPYVDKLKFDKIVMNLAISVNEFDKIVERLKDYKVTQYAKVLKYQKGYKYSYRVMVCQSLDEKNPLIKGVPVDKVAFTVQVRPDLMRIKWNPHKIPSAFIKVHMNILLPGGGYKRLVTKGKVSELDEAIDVHKAKLEDFLITYPGFSYSSTIKKGGAVTEYLGKNNGSNSIATYDKTAEIKAKNANFYWNPDNAGFEKETVPKYPIMRVEERHTFKKNPKPSLSDLLNEKIFPNHFKKINITHHLQDFFKGQPKTVDQMVTRQFIQNCNSIGLQQARLNLTPEYRKKMDGLLAENKVDWWNPNILSQRANRVERLINPKPLPDKAISHLEEMLGCLFPHGIYGGGKIK